jgi:hypothetical protein
MASSMTIARIGSTPSSHRLTYRRTGHNNIHVRGYKADSKMRVPAAPSARVSKRLDRSRARLVPHIIGKALGLGWLTDRCSIGDAAPNLDLDF